MVSVLDAPSTAQLRAAIYARVSTLEQGQHGFSLGAQVRDSEALAAELCAVVVAVFEDQDSGATWDLPGLNRLLDAAKRREFDLLIVYDPDRLARNMAKQLVIEEELTRYGVRIQYVTLRLGDSAEDRLLKNVRASIAEYEREKIRMRTARGRREKAERGHIVGTGPAPYGYRYVRDARGRTYALALDPYAAPLVKRIFSEVEHAPLNVVADRLNAEGIPAPRGAKAGWSNAALLTILNNPVYLGTAAYGRRDAAFRLRDPSMWVLSPAPPLVDRPTWDAAHAALARRKHDRPARLADDPYLLRGQLTCAHCGGPLACQAVYKKRYYTCLRSQPKRATLQVQPRCTARSIPAQAIEAIAWSRVTATLLDHDHLTTGLAAAQAQRSAAAQRQQERLAALDQEVSRLRARFDRITDERLDSQPASETERSLRAKADETERAIQRLLVGRAELLAEPTESLTPEEGFALEAFAADVRAGLAHATAEDQRRVLGLLRLTGCVRRDPEHGEQLGRYRSHRFTIDWEAVIPLTDRPHGGNRFRK